MNYYQAKDMHAVLSVYERRGRAQRLYSAGNKGSSAAKVKKVRCICIHAFVYTNLEANIYPQVSPTIQL